MGNYCTACKDGNSSAMRPEGDDYEDEENPTLRGTTTKLVEE